MTRPCVSTDAQRLSVFDMLKVGIGPSSSHTMGPWRAAQRFVAELATREPRGVERISVELYGSLAKTGKGHATDVAIQLGLLGADPVKIDTSTLPGVLASIAATGQLRLAGEHEVDFDPKRDIAFLKDRSLPLHPNALRFVATLADGAKFDRTYYSVGGGFVVTEGGEPATDPPELPFPVDSGAQLLSHCEASQLRICDVVLRNELAWRPELDVHSKLNELERVMRESVFRGCHTTGTLPGGLGVRRRAAEYASRLLGLAPTGSADAWFAVVRRKAGASGDFQSVIDWVTCFALAVNEENAAMGRIVTAPTNGAAGVLPAVLLYFRLFCGASDEAAHAFLLTAGEIGCLFKKGATISAAMGGCQAEIGVSSAMAAAALAEGLGATPGQAAVAAEIAMEHHLGMTCDPIGGLVQVPCIERNAFGAIKAITAARMALGRPPADARVSLDEVIAAMWETARGMHDNYKETSEGGLAVLVPVSVSEC